FASRSVQPGVPMDRSCSRDDRLYLPGVRLSSLCGVQLAASRHSATLAVAQPPRSVMDTTLSGLLRACKDEPFDDVRRLVLADWVEAHGGADRADLVRLQLALDERGGDEPESAAQEVRRDRLLRANAERWLGPAPQWYSRAELKRGFVSIDATPRQLLDHPPEDLPADVIAWLEELDVEHDSDGHDDVLVSSMLGLFGRLELSGDYDDDDQRMGEREVGLLLSNPALEAVRVLLLRWNEIDGDCAQAMARCDRLAGLHELDLDCNPLGDG